VSPAQPGAADLLRSIGLLADGPVRWALPVPARQPGLYVVELGAALPAAPLEMTRVGKWLERLPGLRMDGQHPTSKALHARLAAFWWPDSPVLYVGATERSIGGRVAALTAHVPGDRQPHPDGQWLHLLRDLGRLEARTWWAETDAPEEYLDAFLDAFAVGRSAPPTRPAAALAPIRGGPPASGKCTGSRARCSRRHRRRPNRRATSSSSSPATRMAPAAWSAAPGRPGVRRRGRRPGWRPVMTSGAPRRSPDPRAGRGGSCHATFPSSRCTCPRAPSTG
jgi:hypothetical protein